MNILNNSFRFIRFRGKIQHFLNYLTLTHNYFKDSNCFIKRFVFKESFLKLDKFKNEIEYHEKKFKNDSVLIKQKILDSISKSASNFELRDVNQILFLAKSFEDINLVTQAIKLLLEHTKIPTKQLDGLGIQLMRLVYILDHSELGIKIINDQELNQIFKSGYPKLILMDKLLKENKYEIVIDLFQKFLNQYQDPKLRSTNKFIFPHDQFVLVSIALFKMNSLEAMKKMKEMMNKIRVKRLEFVNTSLPRCFLLAINQNEPEYALKLVSKFDNLNTSLGLNLSIIALSKMGFIEEALRILENMINFKLDPDDRRFEGRFFRTTISVLEEQINSTRFMESSKQARKKFELFKNLINNDNRFISFDLSDLCRRPM